MSYFSEIFSSSNQSVDAIDVDLGGSVLSATGLSRSALATLFRQDGLFGHESDLSPVDRLVRDAIGRRVGERIAAEFAGQQADFALLDVARVGDDGRHRTRLQGAGLTDFGAEGVVYTPFEAILDKHTGEVLELRYDLLQEPVEPQPLVGL